MDYPRPCGCKGRRSCLLCENEYGIKQENFLAKYQELSSYVFCYKCEKLIPGWDVDRVLEEHENHSEGIDFPGILVLPDFITDSEEEELMCGIDGMPWDTSQSGRRKQNFGPKTNFKKMKLQPGQFRGFPGFSRFVQEKFNTVSLLKDYQTIEQCSLEYDPLRGASIDPHIDDCWIWGERVVTVNCLTDSVLTLAPYHGDKQRYNLCLVDSYREHLIEPLEEAKKCPEEDILVRIPMPRRSLIVLYGPPRYQWEHSVLREDIKERRVCIAYREFTPKYLNGSNEAAQEVLQRARKFFSQPEEDSCSR
ncbi:alpha-ketoglutarate-dependent dioxygenase alkB homolog 4 [Lutzomyia longipalpis]|uniref:alpha-ketoglutarate-dependent dioxygenase alkB homolog 4 n=1 Tax=Lutzomyia longipalpis TaxID=7200 RepID=UPI002483A10B|nr:alpha-ketoglutarate-dependent dioxygenase alkB homolog 4 [Lutzomyia longipalpis]